MKLRLKKINHSPVSHSFVYLKFCTLWSATFHSLPCHSSSLWLTIILLAIYIHSTYWFPHISEIMWYLSFCFWHISLSTISSRFIHVSQVTGFTSFLRLNSILLCIYTIFPVSVYVSLLLSIMLQWTLKYRYYHWHTEFYSLCVIQFLGFWGTSIPILIMAILIYIPTNSS